LRSAHLADRAGAIAAITSLWPGCPDARLDWRLRAGGKFAGSDGKLADAVRLCPADGRNRFTAGDRTTRALSPMELPFAELLACESAVRLLWTPCAGPVLGSILVLAAVSHQPESAFVLLLLYGIGAALPMLAFAYGGRYLSRRLLSLHPHTERLQRIGGAIVVGTAIAILLGWDVQIQLWLAPLFPISPL